MLIALQIILSRIFAIRLPFVTIGFGFLPSTFAAVFFGRGQAAAVSGLADLIGALAFPVAPFFPGFTLTAIISGYIRGAGFHNKILNLKNISIVVILNQLATSLLLNSFWMFLINDRKNFFPILVSRLLGVVINTTVQIFLTYHLSKSFSKVIKKSIS